MKFQLNCPLAEKTAAYHAISCRRAVLSYRSPSYYEVSQFLLVDLFWYGGVFLSSRGRSLVPLGM